MALPGSIANETITRVRAATTTDAHGNQVRDWATATETSIIGCSVQPLDGTENIIGRDSIVSRWKLYLPPEADLSSFDRVKHDGISYEVDGDVQKHDELLMLAHKTCFLKLVEG